MTKRIMLQLFAATIAILPAQPAPAAHAQIPGGAIHGIVTDPSGAAIPGASVALASHRLIRTVSTDQSGQYTIFGLPPGHYGVEVHSPGFSRSEKSGLVVSDGYETEADVQLSIAALKQHVTVTSTRVN